MDEQVLSKRRRLLAAILCFCISVLPAQAQTESGVEGAAETLSQTRIVAYTAQEGTHLRFDLSPEGQWIVFDLLGQLWRLPAEGGGAVPLTDAVEERAEDRAPSISPDGEWIAFQSDRPEGRGLWLMPAEGGTPRLLVRIDGSPVQRAAPAWSPGGEEVAFIQRNGLYIHHLESDTTTPVALGERPEGYLRSVAWLADGRIVLHISQPDGPAGLSDGLLWVVDPETGRGEALPTGDRAGLAPSAALDGTRLAYFARDDEDQMQLWVQELDGADARQLTRQEDILAFPARWAPDGNEILYTAGGRLWSVPVEGGAPRQIHFSARMRFERDVASPGSLAERSLAADSAVVPRGWPSGFWVQEVPTPILIQRARIIDGTGAMPLGTRDILIEDGRISRIARSGSITPRRGMHVIAANGRVVVPGLIDLHQQGVSGDVVAQAANLYHGVTTVANLGGRDTQSILQGELALAGADQMPRHTFDDVESFPVAHPRHLDHDAKHCARSLRAVAASSDPAVLMAACADRFAMSIHEDLVQLYRQAGVAVVPGLAEVRAALEVENRGTELLREPGVGPFVTPDLRSLGGYDRSGSVEAIARHKRLLRSASSFVERLHQSGVPLGAASGHAALPGALHLELEELVAAGLSPLEAIRAATSSAAAILGVEAEIGTLEEGKRADLIILEADPLEDIGNTREIWEVIKDGRVVDREELLEWARNQR